MPVRRLIALALVAIPLALVIAVGLAGCGPELRLRALPPDPELPVPTIAIGVPSAASVDLRDVPAAIGVAYVQAVLHALDRVEGEAWRQVVAAGSVGAEPVALIDATTTSALVDVRTETLASLLLVDSSQLASPIGDPMTKVERLVSAGPECVAALAWRDNRGLRPSSTPVRTAIRLRRAAGDSRNPTAFSLDESFLVASPDDEQGASALCE